MQTEKLRIDQKIKIFNNRNTIDENESSSVLSEEPGEEIAEENLNMISSPGDKQETEKMVTPSPKMNKKSNIIPTTPQPTQEFVKILFYSHKFPNFNFHIQSISQVIKIEEKVLFEPQLGIILVPFQDDYLFCTFTLLSNSVIIVPR